MENVMKYKQYLLNINLYLILYYYLYITIFSERGKKKRKGTLYTAISKTYIVQTQNYMFSHSVLDKCVFSMEKNVSTTSISSIIHLKFF